MKTTIVCGMRGVQLRTQVRSISGFQRGRASSLPHPLTRPNARPVPTSFSLQRSIIRARRRMALLGEYWREQQGHNALHFVRRIGAIVTHMEPEAGSLVPISVPGEI